MKVTQFFSTYRYFIFMSVFLLAFSIRVIGVTRFPPSLYWEEVALGYDAYSILTTGKDHHGNVLPLVAFESFGDYKPSGYFYAAVPSIALFGVTDFAVRFPSVLAGSLSVVILMWLTNSFLQFHSSSKQVDVTKRLYICLSVGLLYTFSPWGIMFSRAAWEVNLATCFLLLELAFGMQAITFLNRENSSRSGRTELLWWLGTVFFAVLAMYTYHSARMIAPLLGLVLAIPLLLQSVKKWKLIIVLGLFAVVGLTPFILSLGSPILTQRFAETSIFSDVEPVIQSNESILRFDSNMFSKLLFHRYVYFSLEILQAGFSHFSPSFLFVTGDDNLRHSTQHVGQLYPLDAILLFIGIGWIVKNWQRKYHILWIYALIVLLPVSLTKATPHALRILPLLPLYMFAIGVGVVELHEKLHSIRWSFLLFITLYTVQILFFMKVYTTIYPTMFSSEWQYGYKQMIQELVRLRTDNEVVHITREQGRPAMYYWFYTKTDPRSVQQANSSALKDQGEFLEFEKIYFVRSLEGNEKGLVVSSPEMYTKFSNTDILSTIRNKHNEAIWYIYRVN